MDLWTDDELYALAQKVHPSKPPCHSPPSLKILCLNLAVKMWKTWIDLHEERGINAFKHLPSSLRNDLVFRLITGVDDKLLRDTFESDGFEDSELLLLLLNDGTKSLYLDNLGPLEDCPSLLAQVVAKAPNLELLSINIDKNRDIDMVQGSTKISILESIKDLKNLKHLDLRYYMCLDNDDMILVTDNLKNLVSLKVTLEVTSIQVFGFRNISSLKKLEELHFSYYPDEFYSEGYFANSTNSWIYSWCAQQLPQLRIIDAFLGTPENLKKITPTFSGTSSLEALQSTYFLPEACLPNLRELTFHGEIKDTQFFNKMCSYSNLTTLELHNVRVIELDQILEFSGKQLTSLTFAADDASGFDHFKVVHLCPNLADLSILVKKSENQVENSQFKELVSGKNFRCLENVQFGQFDSHFHETVLPDGFLKFIFEAPAIRLIKISCYYIKKEDCLLTHGVVEGRFQKLEFVYFDQLALDPGCTLDDFGQMVKWLVCGAPKLSCVRVHWDIFRVDGDLIGWAEYPTGAKKFLELCCRSNFVDDVE